MEPTPLTDEEITLGALRETRRRLVAIEAGWKTERAMSKQLTLKLVQDYGYPILKAANISGHNRQTILTWLNAAGYAAKG